MVNSIWVYDIWCKIVYIMVHNHNMVYNMGIVKWLMLNG
jgi:hypothetical protein